ncbi:MAG: DUF2933 domain-containing protein [Candidatus Macondimonas sp.]
MISFFAIAGYFLITVHRAHLLPYLLLLACPLMHIFHHGGHGGHGSHGNGQQEAASDPRKINQPIIEFIRPMENRNGFCIPARLRLVVTGDHQFVHLHHLRLQLCQAAE